MPSGRRATQAMARSGGQVSGALVMRRDLIQDHRAHHRPNSHPNGERERCARGFPRKTTLRCSPCDTLLSTERGHAEGVGERPHNSRLQGSRGWGLSIPHVACKRRSPGSMRQRGPSEFLFLRHLAVPLVIGLLAQACAAEHPPPGSKSGVAADQEASHLPTRSDPGRRRAVPDPDRRGRRWLPEVSHVLADQAGGAGHILSGRRWRLYHK